MPEKQNYEIEKREYIRTPMSFPVEYRFLECGNPQRYPEKYEGSTANVSGGGLLLSGHIPNREWIPDLLMGKILVGVKVFLAGEEPPSKALARVAWVEKKEDNSCLIGLRFKEITRAVQDRLVELVLDHHMP